MSGHKIIDLEYLKKYQIDQSELAKKLIHAYCKQIFIDGLYHADPHPGNILVNAQQQGDYSIVLLDFGATAKINEQMRSGITHFAEGLIRKDTRLLANALREMGFVAYDNEDEAFDRLVEYFYSKLTNLKIQNFQQLNLRDFHDIEDLLELKKLNISFNDLMGSFRVPRDWVLLERTLILLLGITSHLDPKLNPIEIILPYVEEFVLHDRSLAAYVTEMIKEVGVSYLKLPHELQHLMNKAKSGNLEIRNRDIERQTTKIYALGHQLLYSLLAVICFAGGEWWKYMGELQISNYAFYLGVFWISLLVYNLWTHRK